MLKAPCKNCPGRYPGCHDKCPDYQEYNKQQEEIRANRVKRLADEELADSMITKRMDRIHRFDQKIRNKHYKNR